MSLDMMSLDSLRQRMVSPPLTHFKDLFGQVVDRQVEVTKVWCVTVIFLHDTNSDTAMFSSSQSLKRYSMFLT